MPKKGRSNLEGKRGSQKMQTARAAETEPRRSARLAADAERYQRQKEKNKAEIEAAAKAVVPKPPEKGCARNEHLDERIVMQHSCGPMNLICQFCYSKNFVDERAAADFRFKNCCHKHKVLLPPLRGFPEYVKELMIGNDELSKNFKTNIRKYNSALAFASMGANIEPPPGWGPYCFRIHGQIYHLTSALHPGAGESRKFAQLYVLDTAEAVESRIANGQNSGCLKEIMSKLDEMLRTVNPFAHAYKMMYEIEKTENEVAEKEGRKIRPVQMSIKKTNDRRYDIPTANEVAIVFYSDDGAPPENIDISVYPRCVSDKKFERIHHRSPNCDPMVYPLLFPGGDLGWVEGLAHVGKESAAYSRCSMLQHYAYRLATRQNEFNPIWNSGNLAQQFVVDAFLRVEAQRLSFIHNNQKQLRVEMYKGLMDHVNNKAAVEGIRAGKVYILPSSYKGSPRCMQENYQDAMAIVRKFGKPDLFITMTCNPNWPEITDNLEYNQTASDRPDLVARVFHIKSKQLSEDIKVHKIFGNTIASVEVNEFQKRGLPHKHKLDILDKDSKIRDKDDVDKLVCAEIPDQKNNPELYQIILKCNVHMCGKVKQLHDDSSISEISIESSCLDDQGKCTKGYPKDFGADTNINVNGYPVYRRRNDGRTATVLKKGRKIIIDNRYIVPYNPWLSLRFNCHINVEICSSVKSVKYLYKYVYKGHDRATVEIKQCVQDSVTLEWNEIKAFQDTRYVSAPEAMWRLLEFEMHKQSHTVTKLAVHLKDEQNVFFLHGLEAEAAENADLKLTTLLAWFKLNETNPDACQYTYTDIPYHFVRDEETKEWKPRQRGYDNVISRMYTVSPAELERYFLRLLLLHIKGATSFEDIRTIHGITYGTYREAAVEFGLLEDDKEWDKCLKEAITVQSPYKLRQLFSTMCIFCELSMPRKLWDDNKEHLIEDYLRPFNPTPERVEVWLKDGFPEEAEQRALWDVEEFLNAHRKTCLDYLLPQPTQKYRQAPIAFDTEDEMAIAAVDVAGFNNGQKNAFECIINPTNNKRILYLDGPAGTGKTFFYNALISYVRGIGKTALACAFTGIAANLLKGGTTVHSLFGVPLKVFENSTSKIRLDSPQAKLLRDAYLIIVDEVSMLSVQILRVIDLLLREIMNCQLPFGGKLLLIGGDFRQTLPVLRHASRPQIVESCIKRSPLWPLFSVLELTENMRADAEEKEFSMWQLQLGNGNLPIVPNSEQAIQIPSECLSANLIDDIYGQVITACDVKDLETKSILCALNESSLRINEKILPRHEGEMKTYLSIDSIQVDPVNPDNDINYPIEYLNVLTPSGFAPHKLNLKVGCPIMLLINLNKSRGLCNGTRLIVQRMMENVIEAKVITGTASGASVLIPRVLLTEIDENMPVRLKRRQFPVRLAYAMTINKSQGQSFDKVGIYLDKPVFSHGQLYVAFSRGRRLSGVKVQITETGKQGKLIKGQDNMFTPNIVYPEVLGSNHSSVYIGGMSKRVATDAGGPASKNRKLNSTSHPPLLRPRPPPTAVTDIRVTVFNDSFGDPKTREEFRFQVALQLGDYVYGSLNTFVSETNRIEPLKQQLLPFLEKHRAQINILREFMIRRSITLFSPNEMQINDNSINLLPHGILQCYTPVRTTALGNCLYCAVSLCLFGIEEFYKLIKILLIDELVEPSNDWVEFAAMNLEDYSVIVIDAIKEGAWGNNVHMFALSKVLQRPLYTIGQFPQIETENRKDFHPVVKEACPQKLSEMFADNSVLIGASHHIYLEKSLFSGNEPIMIHFMPLSGHGLPNHFTALLPISKNGIQFKPAWDAYREWRNNKEAVS